MKNKILVTGGTGFLGSALTKRLVKKGHHVVVLDNNSRGSLSKLNEIIDNIEYIEGDIRNIEIVKKSMSGCSSIFHLAFINGTKFFYEKPELVLDVGVNGAINSITSAIEHQVKTFILASSSEVYHQPDNIPTLENERALIPDIKNPRFSYSGGKLISELLSINYFRKLKVRDIIFRPHNIFGPDMGFEHVIPDIVKKIFLASNSWKKNEIEIQIQGDGSETRSFCFIEDAIDQLLKIYESGNKGEIYNIGMSKEISINELVMIIAKILEIKISIIPGKIKSGSSVRRCPDITKIQSLGYELNDNFILGLKETVMWYKSFYQNQE